MPAESMRLNELQAELEGSYDVSSPHRVEDFVFHDRFLAGELSGDPSLQGAPEALLVSQRDDDLDVSLFVDPSVMQGLSTERHGHCLHCGNLGSFWVALEGVSHFLYLVCNADLNRCVTRLEMELQAEVDKFVIAARRLQRHYGRVSLDALRCMLFRDVGFHKDLDDDSRQRYQQANQMAARYCAVIQPGLLQGGRQAGLDAELRRFYRMDQQQKMHHIRSGRILAEE